VQKKNAEKRERKTKNEISIPRLSLFAITESNLYIHIYIYLYIYIYISLSLSLFIKFYILDLYEQLLNLLFRSSTLDLMIKTYRC